MPGQAERPKPDSFDIVGAGKPLVKSKPAMPTKHSPDYGKPLTAARDNERASSPDQSTYSNNMKILSKMP